MKIKNFKQIKVLFISTIILSFFASCQVNKKSISTSYTIAYLSDESGDMEIYLTDVDRKTKFKLTNHKGRDGYAAWSPDGKHLAFYAYYDNGKTWSIHTINVDGTNRKRLTHAKNKWDSSPTWSPDGSKIAFSRGYANSEGDWQEEIWLMNSDGSDQAQIKSINGGGPYFTQDNRIVYHSKTNKSEICIADIEGSNMIKLTNNNAEDWHPEVSPDGKQVVFISDRDGNLEVYVMNIDGSEQKRLTNNNDEDWDPSWSPDGEQIIYHTSTDDGDHIKIMSKDGSSVKSFIHNASSAVWLKPYQLTGY